jgi:plastocyanin
MRRTALATALTCLALSLAACSSGTSSGGVSPARTGSSASTAAAPDTIVISSFTFKPMDITVAPGATVHVTNNDSTTHTLSAISSPPAFDTGDIAPGRTVTFTAPAKPGQYPYICQIHQYMHGTLTVS